MTTITVVVAQPGGHIWLPPSVLVSVEIAVVVVATVLDESGVVVL